MCVFTDHLCTVLQEVLQSQCGRSCECREARLHVYVVTRHLCRVLQDMLSASVWQVMQL